MTVKLSWVRLPSGWINTGGLRHFSWRKGSGSTETAALMALIAITHRADQDTGIARVTYDVLSEALSMSRTVLARALDLLGSRGLISRDISGQSTFGLVGFDPKEGWAILPALGLYRGEQIEAFRDFHLRKLAELDAIKLYLAIVAGRDRKRNRTFLTYEQIEERTGVPSNRMRTALTILGVHRLVHSEQRVREGYGVVQFYRLPQVESRRHGGTTGRQEIAEGIFDEFDD